MSFSIGDNVGRWSLVLAWLLMVIPTHLSAQPRAIARDTPDGPAYRPGELLVKFREDVTDEQIGVAFRGARLGLIKSVLTEPMRRQGGVGVTHASTPLPVGQAVAFLKQLPGVEYAEPNWVYESCATSVDDLFYLGGPGYDLWGMYGPNTSPANQYGSAAAEAWAAGFTGDPGVCIGIIDEGIDFNHPDLAANVWVNPVDSTVNWVNEDGNAYTDDVHGWNFLGDNNQVFSFADGDRHGTHIAGTIAASGGNGVGVSGVAWKVKVISGKFIGPYGGDTADAVAAVDYFTDLKQNHGINIVALNNSWGGGGFSQTLLDAMVRAAKQNILFVAAAGNGDETGQGIDIDRTPFFPACCSTASGAGYDSVISVTAIMRDGSLVPWANYGSKTVDLGAPGFDIWSTQPGDGYDSLSGTSMATAHVTGAIALYAATHPGVNARSIRDALLSSAKRIATHSLSGRTVTGGRLNVKDFINTPTALAAPFSAPVPPSAPLTEVHGTSVTLRWVDNSLDETGFLITRTGGNSPQATGYIVAADRTSYTDDSASENTAYYYTVAAVNAAGPSAAVGAPATTSSAIPAHATLLGLDGTTGGSWKSAYGSEGYALIGDSVAYPAYADVFSSGDLIQIWAESTSDARALQKVTDPSDRIAACWYSSGSFVIDLNIRDSIEHRVTLYAVDWESYGRAQTYEVLDAVSGVVLSTQEISSFQSGLHISWNILGHVRIRISCTGSPNAVLSGLFFDEAGVRPPAPKAPIGLRATASSGAEITLSWTDNSMTETGFRIERTVNSSDDFTLLTTVPAGTTSYVDAGLSANTVYAYRVIAFNSGGDSPPSDPVTATTPAPPEAPSGLVVVPRGKGILSLDWEDNSSDEDGFKIERSLSADSGFTEIATVGKSVTSYSDSGLKTKRTYYYRLRAFNTNGDSAYSNTAFGTVGRGRDGSVSR